MTSLVPASGINVVIEWGDDDGGGEEIFAVVAWVIVDDPGLVNDAAVVPLLQIAGDEWPSLLSGVAKGAKTLRYVRVDHGSPG